MSEPRSGLVAVLFTDLVGSTELMSQLGDRAFDGLRRRHFAALAKAVAAHGGEEVKNTGDGLMAVFPSAAEAVEAAVAMQQATARQAKGTPLSIRVGVAVGDATFEDGDYFGTPVVEAARLVAAARSGEILATAVVRMLAGSRSTATFTDQGPLDLKGLPEPLAVCQVAWEPAASSLPMPALLTDVGRVFVGRDAELERLHLLWKEASAGERRLALVAGEPGVGKTRLAAELAVGVHEEGGTALAGRCDEDLGVPYQPFVEALRHFVDHAPVDDLREHLGRYGGELARLLPELTERLPDLPSPLSSDPETERYRLFDAVAAWLAAVSAENPVLLVLDDLQWAAKPTLLLLRHLLRSTEAMRLLVVGTYRDTDIGRGDPLAELLADFRRLQGVERFSLVGLDSAGVAAFLEQAAGHDLDSENETLARAVWQETEGNPFFVTEVLRHLTEAGALERRDGRWVATKAIEDMGIPEGVRDVVGRRLSRLSEATNRVLRLASVIGLEFEAPVLLAAGRGDEDEVFGALDEAVSARLLSESGGPETRYRFSHSLVRATLYEEISGAHRAGLHRRVAEAVEAVHVGRLDDYLPALAHHYARAAVPAAETAKAVEYANRAGDRALVQLAHDEALSYYRSALDLLDAAAAPADDARRLELLIALGEAQRRAGDPAHRDTLLEAARMAQQRGDADALARAALANNRGMHSMAGRVDAERVGVLEAALAALPPGDSPWRARLLASLAAELGWAPGGDRRLAAASEALAIARRLGDPTTLAHVLALRWTALPPFDPARMEAEMAELETVALRLGDPTLVCWAALWTALTALVVADRNRFDAAVNAAAERARQSGQPLLAWMAGMVVGLRSLLSGRLEEAEELALQTFEVGRASGGSDASLVFGTQRFWIRYEQGRLHDVVELLSRAAARPDPDALTVAALSLTLAELGRLEDARSVLESLAAEGFARLPDNYSALYGLTLVAEASARTDHQAASAFAYEHLRPHRGLVAHVGPIGSGCVDHYLGLLAATTGRYDEADGHFREATRLNMRLEAPTWLARTRLEWARMLLSRRQPGDAERARELLSEALATARELGLGGVERQAVTLIGELP